MRNNHRGCRLERRIKKHTPKKNVRPDLEHMEAGYLRTIDAQEDKMIRDGHGHCLLGTTS